MGTVPRPRLASPHVLTFLSQPPPCHLFFSQCLPEAGPSSPTSLPPAISVAQADLSLPARSQSSAPQHSTEATGAPSPCPSPCPMSLFSALLPPLPVGPTPAPPREFALFRSHLMTHTPVLSPSRRPPALQPPPLLDSRPPVRAPLCSALAWQGLAGSLPWFPQWDGAPATGSLGESQSVMSRCSGGAGLGLGLGLGVAAPQAHGAGILDSGIPFIVAFCVFYLELRNVCGFQRDRTRPRPTDSWLRDGEPRGQGSARLCVPRGGSSRGPGTRERFTHRFLCVGANLLFPFTETQ